MRSVWLAVRVGGLFALLLAVVLAAAALVGRRTVGGTLHRAMESERAASALAIARAFEQRAGEAAPGTGEAGAELRRLAEASGRRLALLDGGERVVAATGERRVRRWDRIVDVPCGDRTCRMGRGRALVPLRLGGEPAGFLEVWPVLAIEPDLREFHDGLLLIGLVALLGIAGIAAYLARPIRTMSRSMDRIAGGELDHRVPVKGRDEVARMARSFNEMAERLGRTIRSQAELAAGVSHELRSPLARMKLSLELLRAGAADPARIDELDAEVDALDALVAELLLASRLGSGEAALEPREVDLRALVDEGWRRATAGVAEPPELLLDLSADAARLRADRGHAARLLGNLLENAVHYGAGLPVSVSARREGDRVRLTVQDRGPGVPEAALDRIFEPFFRVDGSRSRRSGGTGLGLMIVRRAVEAHGGTVAARSADSGGLEVTFDLPAA